MSNSHRRNRLKSATRRKADILAAALFEADRVALRKGGRISQLGRDLARRRRRQFHV